MSLRRTPATPSSPAYPPLSAHAESRRRFLKACALASAAAALGLELTGCPSGGGGTGSGTGVKVTPPDWLPWDSPDDQLMVRGEMAMPMGAPVAVVVGDGPIDVTWGDGTKTQLVVAAVVTPIEGTDVKKDFSGLAQKQVEAVQKTAAAQPSSVLGDPKALDALEAALLSALNGTLTNGGYISEVSAAEAERAPRQKAPAEREARELAPAKEEVMEPAREEASAPSEAAPAPAPARSAPKAKRFWSACRRPGCTSCGR